MSDFNMTIDGQQVHKKETFDVVNPATGELVAKCPNASIEDLDAAVTAAKKAFPAWAALPDPERKAICTSLAGKLEEEAENKPNSSLVKVRGAFSIFIMKVASLHAL